MNKRLWKIIGGGFLLATIVLLLQISHPNPPIVGPLIETSPGHFAQETTDFHLPKSAVLSAILVALLTFFLAFGVKMRQRRENENS